MTAGAGTWDRSYGRGCRRVSGQGQRSWGWGCEVARVPQGFWLGPGSRKTVPGSGNQWPFGKGRVSGPCPCAVELETPSPELQDGQKERRGVVVTGVPYSSIPMCVTDRKQSCKAP